MTLTSDVAPAPAEGSQVTRSKGAGLRADFAQRGQRILTFLIYLNEDSKEGNRIPGGGAFVARRHGDALCLPTSWRAESLKSAEALSGLHLSAVKLQPQPREMSS